jgi:hypothetical protein
MSITVRRAIPSGWWFTLRRPGHTTRAWEVPTRLRGCLAIAKHLWKEAV